MCPRKLPGRLVHRERQTKIEAVKRTLLADWLFGLDTGCPDMQVHNDIDQKCHRTDSEKATFPEDSPWHSFQGFQRQWTDQTIRKTVEEHFFLSSIDKLVMIANHLRKSKSQTLRSAASPTEGGCGVGLSISSFFCLMALN